MGVFTQTFEINKTAMSVALDLLPGQPRLFTESFYKKDLDQTAHPLAIGWNKINGVRGWLQAAGLVAPMVGKPGSWVLTPLGELIALYDHDLKRQPTWWLIHIQLATNPEATVYHLIFSDCPRPPFTRADAINAISARVAKNLARGSVESDVDGVLRSFSAGTKTKLATLGLLVQEGDRWTRGIPEGLTLACVSVALYTVRERLFPTAPSMALQVLVSTAGGLRAALGLDARDLGVPLRHLTPPLSSQGYLFTETAGLDSITFGAPTALDMARRLYGGELSEDIAF